MDQGKLINKPKVSVIIPVYNTEAYVEEAVRSIMYQTLKDIEIIIIDDGSTDNSLPVIKKLALEDDRVKFHVQTNQGLSQTRNYGIKIASGEYIHFMDSDDILAPETFEKCYRACIEKNLDFIFFDADSFSEENSTGLLFDYHRTDLFEESKTYTGIDMLDKMLDTCRYKASACLNLIKKDFIKEFNLSFYPGVLHEDELFTAQLYFYAQHVSCIQKAFYKRRVRKDSIMTRAFKYRNIEGYLTVAKELSRISAKNRTLRKVTGKLIAYILNPAIYNSGKLPLKERIKVFIHCIRYNYVRSLRFKNILVLLFPYLIKIKSVFK